jgi:hypothetical protein
MNCLIQESNFLRLEIHLIQKGVKKPEIGNSKGNTEHVRTIFLVRNELNHLECPE